VATNFDGCFLMTSRESIRSPSTTKEGQTKILVPGFASPKSFSFSSSCSFSSFDRCWVKSESRLEHVNEGKRRMLFNVE